MLQARAIQTEAPDTHVLQGAVTGLNYRLLSSETGIRLTASGRTWPAPLPDAATALAIIDGLEAAAAIEDGPAAALSTQQLANARIALNARLADFRRGVAGKVEACLLMDLRRRCEGELLRRGVPVFEGTAH
ncbi:hypothetical protein CKO28_00040 [Rhodovibrio sodomensis]|uniref:Uncharacterized protein n=1 Tax=Rhodovibrio sodomensis TaxID=1088 RepID=A0ABS1D9K9_9PROT|nr:hypothetical protein [Rhodovibrio sodomensis]MBK1666428.1 hypothetical protein [Rhodovibrio sodomensis]